MQTWSLLTRVRCVKNAANRLFGNLGQLAEVKRNRPGMQIAVAGCLAQQMGQGIIDRAPWVDVVFGTHNIDVLPALLERSRHNAAAAVELEESLKVFPSTLPTRRESVYAGWVSIAVGCNNTCTFCIVPSLRGKQRDRRPGEILAEVRGPGSPRAPSRLLCWAKTLTPTGLVLVTVKLR